MLVRPSPGDADLATFDATSTKRQPLRTRGEPDRRGSDFANRSRCGLRASVRPTNGT
jgi:hypothetical protein